MRPFLAIVGLTWKAAFRFRLFWVLSALLLGVVVLLPLVIKDDGTARGFTQILLTYTLSMITALLGLATLWVACGTLARDIEECQMHLVAVKPVPRWQVWLGKWAGLLLVNSLLLTLCGGALYGLLLWRAQKLPPAQQAILHQEVLVARDSLREPSPDLRQPAENLLRERLKKLEAAPSEMELEILRNIETQRLRAYWETLAPNEVRRWELDLGWRRNLLRDQPLFVRVKFNAAQAAEGQTFKALWQIGPPESPRLHREEMSLAPDTYHEFAIPPNLFDDQGKLTIDFVNYNNTTLLFPLEDCLEVLYREGGFGLNLARGLGIIFCWVALLGAIGLAAASYLTFPVATFASFTVLLVGLSTGVMGEVVEQGSFFGPSHEEEEHGAARQRNLIDVVMVPLFRGTLAVVQRIESFSPIEALSGGRSITWADLGRAVLQIVLLPGGMVILAGIYGFQRRELAALSGGG